MGQSKKVIEHTFYFFAVGNEPSALEQRTGANQADVSTPDRKPQSVSESEEQLTINV